MTAESLKSFISLPSHGSQCSNNRYANGNKIRNIIFAVFMVLLCCGILGLEVFFFCIKFVELKFGCPKATKKNNKTKKKRDSYADV